MNDSFKYFNDTYSSMDNFLNDIKKINKINNICKKYGLNIHLLKDFFILSSKGYNNKEIAQELGIHRVTIQRYVKTFKKMDKKEFVDLFSFIIKNIDGDEYEDK